PLKWRSGNAISFSGRSIRLCITFPSGYTGFTVMWAAGGNATGEPAYHWHCVAGDWKSIRMEMIVCSQMHFSYSSGAGEVVVLRGIDLAISQGEHVAIVGPSGAGKSTLLRLCAGLDFPRSGVLQVGGIE